MIVVQGTTGDENEEPGNGESYSAGVVLKPGFPALQHDVE